MKGKYNPWCANRPGRRQPTPEEFSGYLRRRRLLELRMLAQVAYLKTQGVIVGTNPIDRAELAIRLWQDEMTQVGIAKVLDMSTCWVQRVIRDYKDPAPLPVPPHPGPVLAQILEFNRLTDLGIDPNPSDGPLPEGFTQWYLPVTVSRLPGRRLPNGQTSSSETECRPYSIWLDVDYAKYLELRGGPNGYAMGDGRIYALLTTVDLDDGESCRRQSRL